MSDTQTNRVGDVGDEVQMRRFIEQVLAQLRSLEQRIATLEAKIKALETP